MSTPTTPDYKSTVLTPQTEFPMKGNLPQKEPEIIKKWEDNKIYQKIVAQNQGQKKFIMPDGPPYANAPIHIGHSLNKILKDVIIKYKNMQGLQSEFIPGWDCHGLPIEHKVTKDLGAKRAEKSDDDIRKLCRVEAQKWVGIQREQFKRLGVLADWENPYLTMDANYEAEEIRELARAHQRGVLYRGEKPVYWCWALQTALADAEVEYHDHKSPSIYVKFEIQDVATLKKLGSPKDKTYFAIWTTTPWTLPANMGVCLNADFDYAVYSTGSENLILAKGLKEFFEKETGVSLQKEIFTFKGKDLERGKARHPFIERDSLVVLGDHVSLEAGTGVVHTAPGHGADDYRVGLEYGLEVLSPVDEAGLYTIQVPEYKGTHIFKANPLIIERLKTSGHLIFMKEIVHSYPHCWRSKTPLIFRATPQWFIGLDLAKENIRQKALSSLKEIKFYPSWGEARLKAMMENRPDWCLSRQRIWGVPIPIFYCIATGEPLVDYNVMMKVADVVEKEGGIDAYFTKSDEFFTSDVPVKGAFGSKGFRRGKDILDVWFDSGVCHAAVQKKRLGGFPADVYLEGSDQHRGWFNTSLLSSLATNGVKPYNALITHGFVNDVEGKKMSKSKGNVVDPQEISSKMGAEILRLWSVYEDYGEDLTCGEALFTRVAETYRRIRNTMRFLLGANFDFDPDQQKVAYNKLTPIDQWALNELYHLNKKVTHAFDNYEFYKVYHLINQFFTVTLSATYLDVLKDRLYTGKKDGLERKASQTVIHTLTEYLVFMLAPVLSFLSEEVYGYMKGSHKESVFLNRFPSAPEEWNNPQIAVFFADLWGARELAQKELENLRTQKVIGSSLDAQIKISLPAPIKNNPLCTPKMLKELLIVSQVSINEGPVQVQVEKASGEKCVRCWNYDVETNKNSQFPMVCPKCVEALS